MFSKKNFPDVLSLFYQSKDDVNICVAAKVLSKKLTPTSFFHGFFFILLSRSGYVISKMDPFHSFPT